MMKVQEYKETNYEIIWGYLSIIILVLFSSFSNGLFLGDLNYDYFSLGLIILAFWFRYKSIPIIYVKIILIFIAYNIIHLLIYHDVHVMFMARYIFYISLAFFAIRINFDSFSERLEKVIYYGALISLPLFALQVFFFGPFFNVMSSLQHLMGLTAPPMHDGRYYANTFFFTINTSGNPRNCGFMFEPGAFGSILAIGAGLNLVHNKLNLYNKRLIVLLLALVTTFSTTAFLALICLILFYMANKDLKKLILLIPAGVALIVILFQLPFMSSKISKLSSNPNKQLNSAIRLANDTNIPQSLGRFAGLLMNIKDFEKAPVFGIGGHDLLTEKVQNNWDVNSVNGLGGYLVTFGLIGLILLLFNLSMTFLNLTNEYDLKGFYYLVMVILIVTFSFVLLPTPLFFAFQLYYLARAKIVTESELNILAGQPNYFPS